MESLIDLRTPSFFYNHGGYYAPVDPRHCNTPGGPCGNCQERIDMEEAAQALLALANSAPRSPPCCSDRPDFLEPCPSCNTSNALVTHKSKGVKTCNGCTEPVCTNCFSGARYFCPLRTSLPPPGPLVRQTAVGVRSPKAEEKKDNK